MSAGEQENEGLFEIFELGSNEAKVLNLFPGEQIDFEIRETNRRTLSDEAINDKYVSGEVRIVTEAARYPLASIAAMVRSNDYELNPEFQRRHRWSPDKQSRLIESFIMNVPVPPIFLYEDEYSHYEVMDGLQRLTAISMFYEDRLRLTGLTEWPELEGRRYSDLPDQVRRGIDRRYLSSIILLRETAKSATEAEGLKQLVFERINSGGVKLASQESRNAIYNGPLNRLCIQLSANESFCLMWGIPRRDSAEEFLDGPFEELENNKVYKTMGDVELVLRFFAHRQRQRVGGGALNTYLDLYLKQGNLYGPETLDRLGRLFTDTADLVFRVLGEKAFWLWRTRNNHWAWLERPTTTAYDSIMFVFSQHLDQSTELLKSAVAMRAAMPGFYEKNVESFDGRMTNMANLRERDWLVQDLVRQVLETGQYTTES